MLLENRNALVYGTGGKIGAAVARAFEDEHPPAGHQMLQVIRQLLDP